LLDTVAMPERNSLVATATHLLVEQAKAQLHAAWLQPGSRSMDRMADRIIDELVESLSTVLDFRLAQICGVPSEGAPVFEQVQQVMSGLLPLTADGTQYSKPSAPANSAFG
jgi:hypothetical protein